MFFHPVSYGLRRNVRGEHHATKIRKGALLESQIGKHSKLSEKSFSVKNMKTANEKWQKLCFIHKNRFEVTKPISFG